MMTKRSLILKYIWDNFGGTNSLVILDNCASCQMVKKRVSLLIKLAFLLATKGVLNHCSNSKFTGVSPGFRDNSHYFIIFRSIDRKSFDDMRQRFLLYISKEDDFCAAVFPDVDRKIYHFDYTMG